MVLGDFESLEKPRNIKKFINRQNTNTPETLRKLTRNHLMVFWLNFAKNLRFLFCFSLSKTYLKHRKIEQHSSSTQTSSPPRGPTPRRPPARSLARPLVWSVDFYLFERLHSGESLYFHENGNEKHRSDFWIDTKQTVVTFQQILELKPRKFQFFLCQFWNQICAFCCHSRGIRNSCKNIIFQTFKNRHLKLEGEQEKGQEGV